jgi:DNA-binding transcriptional LysR family regulator
MVHENPRSTARIGKHPIHPILVPFPIVCFVGTLLTDLTYWRTADMMWADFSAWLVTVGVIMGWLRDPPYKSKQVRTTMLWHRRLDHHPAHSWLRDAIASLAKTL